MLVECKLKRPGGSQVELGGVTYHFKDDGTGRHVAMVSNSDHLGRLLSITEGYKLAADQAAQPAAPTPAPVAPSAQAPAPAVVVVAQGAGAVQTKQAAALVPDQEEPQGTPTLSEDMDIEQIRDIYERELGRKPNPNWKAATLIAGITGARNATS